MFSGIPGDKASSIKRGVSAVVLKCRGTGEDKGATVAQHTSVGTETSALPRQSHTCKKYKKKRKEKFVDFNQF